MKKDIEAKIENRKKREDLVFTRLMVIVFFAVALIVALMAVRRTSGIEYTFVTYVLPYLKIAGGVLLAASVVYLIVVKSKHTDESMRILSSYNIVLMCLEIFAILMLYKNFIHSNLGVTITALIVILVLNFVYYIYQKDFFCFALVSAIGALLLYYCRTTEYYSFLMNVVSKVVIVLAIAFPIIVSLLTATASKNRGVFLVGGKKMKIFKDNALYFPIYVACLIILAGSVLSLLFGGAIAFYAVIASLASFLLFTIVYTIKLI